MIRFPRLHFSNVPLLIMFSHPCLQKRSRICLLLVYSYNGNICIWFKTHLEFLRKVDCVMIHVHYYQTIAKNHHGPGHRRIYMCCTLNGRMCTDKIHSSKTVHHVSIYIIIFLTWHDKALHDDKKHDLHSLIPFLASSVSILLMTSQFIVDDATVQWRNQTIVRRVREERYLTR